MDVVQEISKVQNQLGTYLTGVTWVKKEAMHLTLIFLGDNLKTALIPDILTQMKSAAEGFSSFSISFKGVTAFPDLLRPRVVVSEVDGGYSPLSVLKKRLDRSLSSLGFPVETRPFKGHLTLGRIKKNIDPKMLRKLLFEDVAQTRFFEASPMTLFRSELRPSGPIYHKLDSISFSSE